MNEKEAAIHHVASFSSHATWLIAGFIIYKYKKSDLPDFRPVPEE